jgi:hypothetical protein
MALGLTGFLLWLKGGFAAVALAPAREKRSALPDEAAAEHPLNFLRRMKTWGTILLLSALTLTPLITGYGERTTDAVRARPAARHTNAPPVVVFPKLTLQGITFYGEKSTALINGQVLRIGEGIGKARVVEIEAAAVTMELDGQTKVLFMEE